MMCQHKNLSFITSSHGVGVGIGIGHSNADSVNICEDCGQFEVFSRVNNESQTVRFSINNEHQVELALLFVNRIRQEEGLKPLELKERL